MVHLSNGHRIAGNVLSGLEPSAEILRLRTGHGIVSLPRNLVIGVDGDLAVQQQFISTDDYSAQLELVLWAVGQERYEEALEAITALSGNPKYDTVGRRLRAQLTDRVHGAEAALPWYKVYQNNGGDDPEAIARLKEIVAAQNKYKAELAAYEAEQRGDSQKPEES